MDPVALARHLGGLVFHAAAKDARVNPEHAVLNGVLDNSSRRLAPDEPRTDLRGDGWANEWPKNSAWDFVALGKGHNVAYSTEFLRAPSTKSTRTCWSLSSTRNRTRPRRGHSRSRCAACARVPSSHRRSRVAAGTAAAARTDCASMIPAVGSAFTAAWAGPLIQLLVSRPDGAATKGQATADQRRADRAASARRIWHPGRALGVPAGRGPGRQLLQDLLKHVASVPHIAEGAAAARTFRILRIQRSSSGGCRNARYRRSARSVAPG